MARNKLHRIITGIGAVAAGVAAIFWFWASIATVPDNIDTIIVELQWISRLNAYAAMAAGIGAVCGLVQFWQNRD